MYRQNFSQSKYGSCFWSSIPAHLFWWCSMKPKYVVTETLTLYLVPDLSLKCSVKPHAILLDKIGPSNLHRNPSAAVPDILKLWGEAFGMGVVEGWVEEHEDRLGEKEVVLMMVMMGDSGCEREQVGNMLKKYVLSSAEVYWSAQMNRWTGK